MTRNDRIEESEGNVASSEVRADGSPVTAAGSAPGRSVEEVERWLVAYVAQLLDMPEREVGTATPFDEFGLDSIAAVAVISALEKWLGHEVPLGQVKGAPTIAFVARLAAPARPDGRGATDAPPAPAPIVEGPRLADDGA